VQPSPRTRKSGVPAGRGITPHEGVPVDGLLHAAGADGPDCDSRVQGDDCPITEHVTDTDIKSVLAAGSGSSASEVCTPRFGVGSTLAPAPGSLPQEFDHGELSEYVSNSHVNEYSRQGRG
jgi:hypothetical protein